MTVASAAIRRLGVLGGAFDPPHVTHRLLAQAAWQQLQLDRLLVMPTGRAWHKSRSLSDAQHRVAMAQLAFDGLPGVQVDTREIDRAGPSYTIDTLRELRIAYPDAVLFLVIGQDQAQALAGWREWEQVVALATIAVAGRPMDPVNNPNSFQPPEPLRQRFAQLQLPVSDISATDIRRRVSRGQSVVPLVGEAVARYIVLHRLYQNT